MPKYKKNNKGFEDPTRLPNIVKPLSYDLKITPNYKTDSFKGQVDIESVYVYI